jgi:uncharacterized DUF497 family protein
MWYVPSVRRLIWDTWNVAHIARHNVSPDEVEAVCHGKHAIRATYAGRIILIGLAARRLLTVVLAPRGRDVYYPVTARPASRRERAIYQAEVKMP